MSSNSLSKCPLCLKTVLVKNFKRHCKNCHDSVDSEEKYEKLFFKLKENLDTYGKQASTKNSMNMTYLK